MGVAKDLAMLMLLPFSSPSTICRALPRFKLDCIKLNHNFHDYHFCTFVDQAKLKFSDQFGVAPKGFSDTRWWSVLVQGVQLFVYYDGLEEYFTWLVVNDIAKESAQVCLEYVHLGFPPFVLSFCRSLHVSFRFLSFWFIRSLFLVFQLNQHLGVYR